MIEYCALIFVVLFLASITMQYQRARKRKSLVDAVDHSLFSMADQEKWEAIQRSADFLLNDFRKLQIVKRNVTRLSDENLGLLERYKRFSRIEMVVTASMVLYGVIAYYLCS